MTHCGVDVGEEATGPVVRRGDGRLALDAVRRAVAEGVVRIGDCPDPGVLDRGEALRLVVGVGHPAPAVGGRFFDGADQTIGPILVRGAEHHGPLRCDVDQSRQSAVGAGLPDGADPIGQRPFDRPRGGVVAIGDRAYGRADLGKASEVVISVRQAPVGPKGHGRDAIIRIVRVVQGGLVIATHRGQATEAVIGIRDVAERVLQSGALPKAVHGRDSACPIRLRSGHTLEPTLGVELSLPGGCPPLGVNDAGELPLRIVGELPLQSGCRRGVGEALACCTGQHHGRDTEESYHVAHSHSPSVAMLSMRCTPLDRVQVTSPVRGAAVFLAHEGEKIIRRHARPANLTTA